MSSWNIFAAAFWLLAGLGTKDFNSRSTTLYIKKCLFHLIFFFFLFFSMRERHFV